MMINRVLDRPSETKPAWPELAANLSKLDISQIHRWRHDVEQMIGKYPGAFLAAAVGAGFLFGWWNKRK